MYHVYCNLIKSKTTRPDTINKPGINMEKLEQFSLSSGLGNGKRKKKLCFKICNILNKLSIHKLTRIPCCQVSLKHGKERELRWLVLLQSIFKYLPVFNHPDPSWHIWLFPIYLYILSSVWRLIVWINIHHCQMSSLHNSSCLKDRNYTTIDVCIINALSFNLYITL